MDIHPAITWFPQPSIHQFLRKKVAAYCLFARLLRLLIGNFWGQELGNNGGREHAVCQVAGGITESANVGGNSLRPNLSGFGVVSEPVVNPDPGHGQRPSLGATYWHCGVQQTPRRPRGSLSDNPRYMCVMRVELFNAIPPYHAPAPMSSFFFGRIKNY